MSEPRLDDDIALGKDEECQVCEQVDCVCFVPDRMWNDD